MTDARAMFAALRSSHDRLASLITPLSPAELAGPSYCDEWSIAQVLSHLGSGAEIFALFLDAGLAGREPPGQESFLSIWDKWNARSPEDQAACWRDSSGTLAGRFASLDDGQLAGLRLELFGTEFDAAGLARIRLSEQTLHSWDIAVALDPAERLAADAVALLVGALGPFVSRLGKPQGERLRVAVHTTDPSRDYLLTVGEGVQLADAGGEHAAADEPAAAGREQAGELRLPCEAFIRLLSGRLDPRHTPDGVAADGVSLDTLRAVFPGF
jgi:uncharacterized protein (TIGR03083 family)